MLLNKIARDEREVVVAVRPFGLRLINLLRNIRLHHHAIRVNEIVVDCLAAAHVTIALEVLHLPNLAEKFAICMLLHVLSDLHLLLSVANLVQMFLHDALDGILIVVVDALTELDHVSRVDVLLVESVTGLAHALELGIVLLRVGVRHMEALEVTRRIAVGARLLN